VGAPAAVLAATVQLMDVPRTEVVVDLVQRRGRVAHDEAVEAAGQRAVLRARALGLVRLEGVEEGHPVLTRGNNLPASSLYDENWHDKAWRRGRWR
jgi:hypothetical protein